MSAWFCRSIDGKAARKIVPPRPRIPSYKGLGADSEEKHEPASDIDIVVVDSLKALDPKRPIREAVAQRGSASCRSIASCSQMPSITSQPVIIALSSNPRTASVRLRNWSDTASTVSRSRRC